MSKKVTIKKETSTKQDAHRKMSAEELQMFLHFKKRGAVVPAKKGKGSYNRKKMKKYAAAQKRKAIRDFDSKSRKSDCLIFRPGALERLLYQT